MAEHPRFVWLNGEVKPWAEATVHVTQIGPASVSSVFEGIRGYWNAEQEKLYVFQLDAHLKRFMQSIRMIRLQAAPFDTTALKAGVLDLLRANEVRGDIYIRPFAYAEAGTFGAPPTSPTEIAINTSEWASRLKSEKLNSAVVVSWTRISDNVMPPRVKASANYLNSRYAAEEARRHGYDSAILLHPSGHVAEGPGACLMIVRDGKLITPSVTSGILESITRETVLELVEQHLRTPVQVREVDRTELYVSDEAFFCGTGMEITPIASVDRQPVGNGQIGPLTRRLMDLYHDLVRGVDPRCGEWRTAV